MRALTAIVERHGRHGTKVGVKAVGVGAMSAESRAMRTFTTRRAGKTAISRRVSATTIARRRSRT